jgi:hypothetical protein
MMGVAAVLSTVTATAQADPTKDACIDADTKSQSLRREGKLASARQQLRVCVAAACPALVRDDCAQRLDEIEHVQPTIVFRVQDARAHDVMAVRVSLDGQAWLDHVDGSAIPVDPGPHRFRFEVVGEPPIDQLFVLREGEKARIERVVVGGGAGAVPPAGAAPEPPIGAAGVPPAPAPIPLPPSPAPGPAAATLAPGANVTPPAGPPGPAEITAPATISPGPAPTEPAGASPGTSDSGRTLRITGLVVGGVGVAGLIVASIAAASAASSWSDAQSECSTTSCPQATYADARSKHDAAQSAATVSTIGFVAGGALAAAGVVLYLAAPASRPSGDHALCVTPLVSASAGGIELRGGF